MTHTCLSHTPTCHHKRPSDETQEDLLHLFNFVLNLLLALLLSLLLTLPAGLTLQVPEDLGVSDMFSQPFLTPLLCEETPQPAPAIEEHLEAAGEDGDVSGRSPMTASRDRAVGG